MEIKKLQQEQLKEEQTANKFFIAWARKKYKDLIMLLYDRMVKMNYSIEDIKTEIENKKSPFTYSQRAIIYSFKNEFLEKLLCEILTDKQLKLINYEINSSNS